MSLQSILSAVLGSSLSAILLPSGDDDGGGLVSLPSTPTVRYHAVHSTVVTSGGRVTSATDLMGLADASNGSSTGPYELTDALGRKFWRFEGAEWLAIADDLVTATKDVSAFAVCRVLRTASRGIIFSQGRNGVVGNTGGGPLETRILTNSAPYLSCNGRLGYDGTTGAEHFIPGAQLQVLGGVSGASNTRYLLNRESSNGTATSTSTTGILGGEIGRFAFNNSSYALVDLYELVIYDSALSLVDAQAVAEALADGYSITNVDSQLVLEGDSITQGTGLVTAGYNAAAVLTNPGQSIVPANYRVINMGLSGNQVSNLTTRRDATNGWPGRILSGENIVAFEIGRNDMYTGAISAADHYTNVMAYINTTTTGLFQRGWTVRQLVNIATGDTTSGTGGAIGDYRALILDTATYLAALDADVGGTYAGQFSTINTHLIEDGGDQIFFSSVDASDTNYYAGDTTHPTILGAELRVTGGDDATLGIAYGIT